MRAPRIAQPRIARRAHRASEGSRFARVIRLTPRETPVGSARMAYWRSSIPPSSFLWARRTRRHDLRLIVAALIVGIRLRSICDASASCCTSLSNESRTRSGADCQRPSLAENGRRSDAATSAASEYPATRNVSVGPRGARQSRRYAARSVAETMRKKPTLSCPATATKSRSLFVLRARSARAVFGISTRLRSSTSCLSGAGTRPLAKTKARGAVALSSSAVCSSFCVFRLMRRPPLRFGMVACQVW